MAEISQIQWCDGTWNIARGCTKVDADCKYCYMYRQSLNATRYKPDQVTKTKTVFTLPLHYKEIKSSCWDGKPLIFTSSLTDFFHEDIDSFRNEAWDIIRRCPHLIFQILTKRPERITECLPDDWGEGYDNVWLGTSVGSRKGQIRITELCLIPTKVRFLSLEPLYELISIAEYLTTGKIHWVIVGGESGNDNGKYRYRKCNTDWIEIIVNHCQNANVPVFVKQVGTYLSKKLKMKDRHGGDFNEFPEQLKKRQFPIIK
jgi:protein gp37